MVLQIALCLALLSATGLLVHTLRRLESVNVGFESAKLLVFGVSPQVKSEGERLAFYRGLTDRLRSIPTVESVTLSGNRLGSEWSNNTTPFVDGQLPPNSLIGMDRLLRWNNVGPDFFSTLGIRIIAGRDLTDADLAEGRGGVAVVNQTLANKYFRGRNPLGHTVSFMKEKPFTIVGLAADSIYTDLQEQKIPMAWIPSSQSGVDGEMHFELRIPGDPVALLPQVRRTASEFAPDLALLQPRTQQAEFEETIASQRLLARLSVSFALLAAILVAVGLYGTTSYQVTRRTSELGVRMALGAERPELMWMVFRSALRPASIGAALGLALTFACSHVLSSLLFNVRPNDPASLACASLGILAVTLMAAWGPAYRAAAVDPIVALRQE